MARAILTFNDADDGLLDFKITYEGGWNKDSGSHQIANAVDNHFNSINAEVVDTIEVGSTVMTRDRTQHTVTQINEHGFSLDGKEKRLFRVRPALPLCEESTWHNEDRFVAVREMRVPMAANDAIIGVAQ